VSALQQSSLRNQLLAGLSRKDFARLQPHLEPVELELRRVLIEPNQPIEHVYFPDSGIVSIVAAGKEQKRRIEIGIIGREGMTGLAVVLGSDRAKHETYIQVAGSGLRMRADELRAAIDRSASLHRSMLRYAHAFLIQTTTTALANQLRLSPSAVSAHLLRLKTAELIESHRSGRKVFYRLSGAGEELLGIFGELE